MLNRWQRTIVDLRGNVVPYAQLQIRVESTQATATIYADRAGNELIPNGIVTADANGYAFFYAEADLYRISSAEPTIDWRYVDIGAAEALQRGNNLSDVTNPATARGNLGLGTAAERDVGTSSGNVMEVGAFGLGDDRISAIYPSDLDELKTTGFYYLGNYSGVNAPPNNFAGLAVFSYNRGFMQVAYSSGNRIAARTTSSNGPDGDPWVMLHHTGNILKSTGNNDEFPMSQKAVTDALNTKANASNPGSMGIGVGQTWQPVSRSLNTVYTNTSSRAIFLNVRISGAASTSGAEEIRVDGVRAAWSFKQSGSSSDPSMSVIVPAGSTYEIISEHRTTVSCSILG